MNNAMNTLAFLVTAVLLVMIAVVYGPDRTGAIDDPAPEYHFENHRTAAPIICEWVPTFTTFGGTYTSSCQVCVDHGMIIDNCELVFGERRELYIERVVPVIDSLLTEYQKQTKRWGK